MRILVTIKILKVIRIIASVVLVIFFVTSIVQKNDFATYFDGLFGFGMPILMSTGFIKLYEKAINEGKN